MFNKTIKWIGAGLLAIAAMALLTPERGESITAWARKYGVSCNVCHVSGYKLTRAGQQFLRGGHKMPGADDSDANLSNYLALTMKLRTWGKSKTVNENPKPTVKESRNSFEAHALSLYTGGPLDKGFSYFAEFYLHENEKKNPKENTESTESDMGDWARSKLAEAYLQYQSSGDDVYWTARMGRIMPWLIHLHGGGARLEYSRPLPLTSTVGDNPYRPFSRQYGAAAGYALKDLFLEAGIVNGTGKHENSVETGSDTAKDYFASLDYSIGDNGSMVGVYYYQGEYRLDWFGKALSEDRFDQVGLLGNYTFDLLGQKGALIGAAFKGTDKYIPTGATTTNRKRFFSDAYYVELQSYWRDGDLSPYVRYDYFDPDTSKASSKDKAGPVLGLHWKPMDHGRFVLEGSQYTTHDSSVKTTRDNDVTLEMQFMF